MNTRALVGIGILVTVAFNAGCGKVSDEQKQDAANLVSGFAGTGATATSGSALQANTEYPDSLMGVMLNARDEATGFAWLRVFQLESNLSEGGGANLAFPTCPTFSGVTGCTASCSANLSVFSVSCAVPDGGSFTCSSTTYTMSSLAFTFSADITNLTGSIGSAGGSFTLTATFSANVSGGKLDGKKLEATVAFTIDVAKLKAHTTEHLEPSCDSFTVKWNGKDISCDDIKAKMAASNLACS